MPVTLTWQADWPGWLAAALMVATFGCREARWMRPLAVATNLAFIGYSLTAALAPVLALHALLLPINLWRWWECIHTPPRQTRQVITAWVSSSNLSAPASGQAGTESWPSNGRPTLKETPR